VKYEAMRLALAECAHVDEAAKIREKADKLLAYARMRDDHELEAWVAEIRIRAMQRCGELSLELDKAERARTDLHPNAGMQTKTQSLAAAGLSTSTAHRYAQLAGGPTPKGQQAAKAATETYFAASRERNAVPTLKGLQEVLSPASPRSLNLVVEQDPQKETKYRVHYLCPDFDEGVEAAAAVIDRAGRKKPRYAEFAQKLAREVRKLKGGQRMH
jgi:hypothetical protein